MGSSKILVIYFVGFVDIFACGMFVTSLSLVARNFGAGAIGLGIFGSLYGILQLFSSPICGELADVYGRKRVLCWCLLLSALGYLALGMSGTFLVLLFCRVPSSLFKHTQTLLKAVLVTNVESAQQTRVLGFYSAASAFGFVFAPTLGGYVFDSAGFSTLMFLVAAIFLFNMLFIICFIDELSFAAKSHANETESSGKEHEEEEKVRNQTEATTETSTDYSNKSRWLKSLQEIWTFASALNTEARLIFIVKFAMSAAVIVYRSNLSVVLDSKFSLSGAQLGAIIGYSALLGSIGGCFIDALIRRVGGGSPQRALFWSACGQLISILLASLATDLHAFVLAQSPLTFCNMVSSVVLSKVLLDSVSRSDTDRKQTQAATSNNSGSGLVFGMSQSVVGLARLVSPFMAGVLLGIHINAPGVVAALFSAVAVVCAFLLLRISNRQKKLN